MIVSGFTHETNERIAQFMYVNLALPSAIIGDTVDVETPFDIISVSLGLSDDKTTIVFGIFGSVDSLACVFYYESSYKSFDWRFHRCVIYD